MNCTDVKDNICAYLDNELSSKDRIMFEEHIESCPACRQELDEMSEIISLCTSLPQQELPGGFREELHERLLAVADSHESNVTKIEKIKRTKYIKMITSIAAGLLLIFLTGGLLKYGFFQSGLTAKDGQNMTMSAAEAPAQPSENAQYEGAAADSAAADSGAGSANAAAMAESLPGITSFSKSSEAPAGTEAGRSVAAKDRSTAAAYASSPQVAETVSNRVSTITITAAKPDATAEKIKVLALENNGEMKATVLTFSESLSDDQKVGSGNAVIAGSTGATPGMPLVYIIPNTNYDKFINSINDSFGAANVQSGALVTEDLTTTLNGEMKRSDEIDAQVQQLQQDSVKNAVRIDELKKEKEALDSRVENIRLNSDFVTVTIYINGK